MKKTDAPAQQRAKELLRQAEDFAAASVTGVVSGLSEDPRRPSRLYRDYTQLTFALEVHFLFPNLNLAERRLLTRFLQIRNALVLRKQAHPRQEKTRRKRRGPADQCELRFQQLRTRARALQKVPHLTPLQQAVLEELLTAQTGVAWPGSQVGLSTRGPS